jgi:hypothetical protein
MDFWTFTISKQLMIAHVLCWLIYFIVNHTSSFPDSLFFFFPTQAVDEVFRVVFQQGIRFARHDGFALSSALFIFSCFLVRLIPFPDSLQFADEGFEFFPGFEGVAAFEVSAGISESSFDVADDAVFGAFITVTVIVLIPSQPSELGRLTGADLLPLMRSLPEG